MKKLCTVILCCLLLGGCSNGGDIYESASESIETSSHLTVTSTNALISELDADTEELPLITDDGNFMYKENDDKITIIKYIGESEAIVTPEEIDGKPVTKIGSDTFTHTVKETPLCDDPGPTDWEYTLLYGNAKHIVVSEGITELGNYAFSNSNIESVKLPTTLASVGEGCFRESSVKNIAFTSAQPVSVAKRAFQVCRKLEYISAVEFANFDWNSVSYCEVLTAVDGITENTIVTGEYPLTASETNYTLCRRFGAVQSGEWWYRVVDGNAEIADYTGNADEIIIPNKIDGYTVISIGNYAFSSNITADGHIIYKREYESIKIPDTVTAIGAYAFYN